MVKCHQCGVPVEAPVARNGKGNWLCDTCWRIAERERERYLAQVEAAKAIGADRRFEE